MSHTYISIQLQVTGHTTTTAVQYSCHLYKSQWHCEWVLIYKSHTSSCGCHNLWLGPGHWWRWVTHDMVSMMPLPLLVCAHTHSSHPADTTTTVRTKPSPTTHTAYCIAEAAKIHIHATVKRTTYGIWQIELNKHFLFVFFIYFLLTWAQQCSDTFNMSTVWLVW